MLFDFLKHIDALKQKEDKKEIVEKYEELHGPIAGNVQDQLWYTDYVSKFTPIEYQVQNMWKDEFDWNLLCQLVGASFSSEVVINFVGEDAVLPEMTISVDNNGAVISRMVSELYPYQIDILYGIYIEEQMNLQNHLTISIQESQKVEGIDESIKGERDEILYQREYRLKKWDTLFGSINRKHEVAQAEKEKEVQLSNLLDQL